ncbi:nucleoside triphosphate hydrolase, putative [Plasmodium malariae]|uniref:Nucleoside triphosphate hydrolase, putative n=1 Tax=Plasmodium malariae TaxID=5858 RepID=A0A1A8WXD7_PLAMA|nr:nucleoside triphosphate hydrolase, putative [Plasmodium malariae]
MNNSLVEDVIRRYVERRKDIINKVINSRDRIPLVEYTIEGDELFICSKYYFIDNIYIKVKKENDKFNLKFVDKNCMNLFKQRDHIENNTINAEIGNGGINTELDSEMQNTELDNEVLYAELDNEIIDAELHNEMLMEESGSEMLNLGSDNEILKTELDNEVLSYIKLDNKMTLNSDLEHMDFSKKERKNLIIILSGTSGGGKSTLSCLLGLFLNIRRILSTDVVREILRKYQVQNDRYLRYSTYESWRLNSSEDEEDFECAQINREWGVQTDEKKKVKSREFKSYSTKYSERGKDVENMLRKRCIGNYSKQCELIFNYVDNIINDHIVNKESIIIEGVHINAEIINKLIKKYPNKIIFFLVYITDKETSIRRFSSRSTDSNEEENKYIKNINYINDIQNYLLETTTNLVPSVNYIENIDIYSSLEKILKIIYSFN